MAARLVWLDPAMGLLGAVIVALRDRRLIVHSAKILLDRVESAGIDSSEPSKSRFPRFWGNFS
ncbi:MAG: hypothetical protein ACREXI_05670 [Caldimonas sp.]